MTFKNFTKTIGILIFMLVGSTLISQTVTEIYASKNKSITKAMALGNDLVTATQEGLQILYNGKWKQFIDISYEYQSQNFSCVLTNNIKDIGIDAGGTIYITTFDNHLLYFYDGQLDGGVPVKIGGLYNSVFDEVIGILKIPSASIDVPVKLLDKIGQVDFIAHSNIYPDLEQLLLDFNSKAVSYNDHFPMVLAADGDRLGLIYESGHKIKVYEKVTSNFPCNIQSFDSHGMFNGIATGSAKYLYNHLACVCEDGSFSYSAHKLGNNNQILQDLSSSEWKTFSKAALKGNVKKIQFKVIYIEGNPLPFLVGITDATTDQIFIYNPRKDEICFVNIPGNNQIIDFDIIGGVLTTGDKVYKIDLKDFTCKNAPSSTLSSEETEILLYPNPTDGIVHLPASFECIKIVNAYGTVIDTKSVLINQDSKIIDLTQQPVGMYMLILKDQKSGYITTSKILVVK